MGNRLWSYSATRGGLVFVAASIATGLSNLLFNITLSRLLGPTSYGALGALLNVIRVLAVPLAALSVTMAQSIAKRDNPLATPPLGRLLKLSVAAGVVGLGLWLAATPSIDRFFHLHSPDATIALGIWLFLGLPGAVLEGVLIGQRRFRVTGIGQFVGSGVIRLAMGVLLVELGFGVVGGVVATVAGSAVVLFIYASALRPALLERGSFVPRSSDALLSSVALGGAAVLTIIDVWLARHFLLAQSAGLFTAAATAGRIAVFLPSIITLVYFPRLAASGGRGPEARRILARATGLVAVLGLLSAGLMALLPDLAIDVLFGASYSHASVALGTVALADAGIGIASCLIYFQVARGSRLALAAWPTCLFALLLTALFHGSIEVLALDMLSASCALVLGLGVPTLLQTLRSLAEDTASLPREAMFSNPPTLDVTVVVPCHNVGVGRLAAHLTQICDTLSNADLAFEVVPVSDGSTDGSETAFDQLPSDLVRPIVWTENRGKGEALRAGLAHGRGRYLGFIDGDGDIPADCLASFVNQARNEQPEIIVGSKRHPDAEVVYPFLRRVYSVGYQLLCAGLFGLKVRDTQTGIKLIRRDVVAEVLPRMVEKRFAFDLELLAVAHRLGYRDVAELPVIIGERFGSTISPRAVWRMLQDTLATFWRLRILRFYDPPLLDPAISIANATSGDSGHRGDYLRERLRRSEQLRVLVCNWRDPAHPHAGGAEVYTARVTRAWAAAGHQVTWFCASVPGRPSYEIVDGVTIIRRGGRFSVYTEARKYYERQGLGRFDLVIDEVNTRPFEAVRWAGDTPVVALAHQIAREVWFHEMPWPGALLGRFFLEPRWLRRLRDVPVLTVSASSKESLAAFGVTDVTVVPEGIDPVRRPEVEREAVPTAVFVGRLARNKRPDEAIEAFRLFRRKVPEARLWLIGDGPMHGKLLRRLPEGVELLGRLSDSEKQVRLARAHCLLATSVREGWGLTVTEAAQMGTPAVAYDVAGLRDSVRASGGLLVRPRPEALAAVLEEHLPSWSAGNEPKVVPGGVLPWDDVAMRLLDHAVDRVDARARGEVIGEDISVAWRRLLGPIGAACDRRAWSVAGIAGLVALAPLIEIGAQGAAGAVASASVGCFAVAVFGAWADALRSPQFRLRDRLPSTNHPLSYQGEASFASNVSKRRDHSWHVALGVGVIAAAISQSWFAADAGGVKTSATVVGENWPHRLTMAFSSQGAASSYGEALRLPFLATLSVLRLIGGSGSLDQRIWLTTLFGGAAMAMFSLLRSLNMGTPACVVGSIAYACSPFVMAMSGPDATYLAAMIVIPGIIAWVLAVARADRLRPGMLVWLVPGAILLGTVANSPPLLLACGAAGLGALLLLWWLDGPSFMRAALTRVVIAMGILAVLSAYWLVPLGLALVNSNLVSIAAHRRWQWTQAQASLVNSFWMNTAWDWGDRTVFPYASAFNRFPLVLWRYGVPICAFAALGMAGLGAKEREDQQRLRLLVVSGAVALIVVVLASGNQEPGRSLDALLGALPFGWLLGDPGRFLFIAGAAYSVLVAAVIDQVLEVHRERVTVAAEIELPSALRTTHRRIFLPAMIALALVIPAFPLFTGAITHYPKYSSPGVAEVGHVLPKSGHSSGNLKPALDDDHEYGEGRIPSSATVLREPGVSFTIQYHTLVAEQDHAQ